MVWDQIIPGVIGIVLFGSLTGICGRWLWLGRASRAWPTTTGKILISNVQSHPYYRSHYSAVVQYEYGVAGQSYCHQRIYFGDLLNANRTTARQLVARYPVNTRVTVRYNPRQPKQATLEARSFERLPLLIAIGLIMCGLIFWGVITGR